jgi:hypothetical protein
MLIIIFLTKLLLTIINEPLINWQSVIYSHTQAYQFVSDIYLMIGGVNPGTNVFFFEYAVVELVQSDTWVFQHQATFDKHLCIQSIAFTFFVKQKRVYSETILDKVTFNHYQWASD